MKRHAAPILAAILLLLPVLYLASYFALVVPGNKNIWLSAGQGALLIVPRNYRWGGSYSQRLFWPLEQIDRRLRPHAWEQGQAPFLLENIGELNR